MSCTKILLFLLNFAVFGVGVAVVTLASLVLSHTSDFSTFFSSGAVTVPIVLLLFGAAVLLLGFLGCCGALRESSCLLNSYAIIVMVLVLGQLGVGIYAAVAWNDFENWATGQMADVLNQYNSMKASDQNSISYAIDVSQHELQCCGINSYKDWRNRTLLPNANLRGAVTVGCCRDKPDHINPPPMCTMAADPDLIYTEGCFTKFYDLIKGKNLWMIIGAVSLGVLQLLCVFAACVLAKSSSRRERYNHY